MINKIYTLEEIKYTSIPIFKKYSTIQCAYLFGSYARKEATSKSDLDFMIELVDDEIETLKDELRVENDLSEAFQKRVDVITSDEVYQIMPKSFERDKILIYTQLS
jgi:predicted nucleotidyltransferase